MDVTFDYIIKDESGKTLVSEQETTAIEKEKSFTKKIQIPKDIEFGTYLLHVKATYGKEVASASAWFFIVEEYPFK